MGQLEKANLTGASVTDSIIEKSTFLGTQLTDADFDGTTISQSNLSDFDSLQMLLDGGIKLGLDNQLPSLFKEIESILDDNLESARPGRGLASDRDTSKLDPTSREELKRIQSELDKTTKLVQKNRELLDSRRADFQELRRQRDRHGKKLQETYDRFTGNRSKMKKSIEELRENHKKMGDLKEEFRKSDGDRDRIKQQLVEADRKEKSLYREIRDIKKSSSREVPGTAQLAKDVRDLINETVTQKNALSAIRADSRNLNARVKELVARYQKILKSKEYAAR